MSRYSFNGTARDGAGNIIQSATISVYLTGTSTPASIYTTSSGGSAVNSVTTETDGSFLFYVDEGDYSFSQLFRIVISKGGYTTKIYDDIIIIGTTNIISDTAFAASWNGVTSIAPSKNAIYDMVSTDGTFAANSDVLVSSQKAIKTYVDSGFAPLIPTEVTKASSGASPLTSDQCKGTIVTNYGMSANTIIALPTAAVGYSFIVILPTAVSYYFKLQAGASDKIYISGVAGSDNGYVGVASGYLTGSCATLFTFKASDGNYDWFCNPIFGTWVAS